MCCGITLLSFSLLRFHKLYHFTTALYMIIVKSDDAGLVDITTSNSSLSSSSQVRNPATGSVFIYLLLNYDLYLNFHIRSDHEQAWRESSSMSFRIICESWRAFIGQLILRRMNRLERSKAHQVIRHCNYKS